VAAAVDEFDPRDAARRSPMMRDPWNISTTIGMVRQRFVES
jgi:hypothetical protein